MPIRLLRRNQTAAFLHILIFFVLACDATLSVGHPTPTMLPPTVIPPLHRHRP